jgi:Na+-transporting NADH:ubiquinone oxidoreductase subunit A
LQGQSLTAAQGAWGPCVPLLDGSKGCCLDFRFRKGRDIAYGEAPRNTQAVPCSVGAVGVMAGDFPGVVFDPCVEEGQSVRRGQVLCVDRQHPEIAFVAASAGRVSKLHHAARRQLDRIELATEGDDEVAYDATGAAADAAALRALLLKSGAWVAFRARPFGRVPAPSEKPSAIFVTATDTNPLAADTVAVLAPQMPEFQRGVAALLHLTDGPVFLCQPPGAPLIQAEGRLRVAQFSGPHPAGLAGTHIHHLWPVSAQRSVWQIGCQDVAAMGHLLKTGKVQTHRVVSVAGPGLRAPMLKTAPLGAKLADLVGTDQNGANRLAAPLISGSILSGQKSAYLGRFDVQVTVPQDSQQMPPVPSPLHHILSRLPRLRTGATLPLEAFERALPIDILPVPLIRALAVGDVETAARLGCLELLEEDMALLTWLCPSGCDYGALLRRVLEDLAQEGTT